MNPFAHLVHDEATGTCISEADEDDGEQLVPDQRPSIIDQRAIVRYFKDGRKKPAIFQQDHPTSLALDSTFAAVGDGDRACYDVTLALDVSKGCGGKIWPAAEVLGEYIASQRSQGQWTGKTMVELGAGTGLVGLLAAAIGQLKASWITDQEAMMDLMVKNLNLNGVLRQRCFVGELSWGQPVPESIPSNPDVLLLADCVYLEVAFQPLIETMLEMSTPSTEILFCYQQRRKADKRFFKLLQKHFIFKDVEDDDEARRSIYNREGTRLFIVHKKT